MPPQPPPEQRLLALATFLLGQDEPLSWERIRESLSEFYGGSDESAERKWTRDKKDLSEVGVPIEWVPPEMGGEGGYVIRPEAFRLPDLRLTPEEAAVLWTAAQAAARMQLNPWRRHVQTAADKLLAACRSLPPTVAPSFAVRHGEQADRERSREIVDRIGDALRSRKRITMDYLTLGRNEVNTRDVDIYGFAWRRGMWLFAGYCHLRQALRVFYVDQVRKLEVNARNPSSPDYDIPRDFDIGTFARQQPWEYWVHAPIAAEVRFRGALAPLAAELLPGAREEPGANGETRAHLAEVRNLTGLARVVLSFGPEAELVSPEEGRARVRRMLDALAARLDEQIGRQA